MPLITECSISLRKTEGFKTSFRATQTKSIAATRAPSVCVKYGQGKKVSRPSPKAAIPRAKPARGVGTRKVLERSNGTIFISLKDAIYCPSSSIDEAAEILLRNLGLTERF
jgi:hypothetical protein